MSASTADLFVGIVPVVASAELRSVSQAARKLGITPSSVSRAITRLETELGIRLLHRTPRTVTLTPEGELFYRDCQLAVAGVRNARAAVSAALAAPRGRLRVSLPLALGERVVMPARPRLVSRHPGPSIEAIITDRYVELASENIDAVVRIGAPRSTGLKRHRLPAIRWATVASPAYLAARGTPRTPDELARHTCLHFVLPNGTTQAVCSRRRAPGAGSARSTRTRRPPRSPTADSSKCSPMPRRRRCRWPCCILLVASGPRTSARSSRRWSRSPAGAAAELRALGAPRRTP